MPLHPPIGPPVMRMLAGAVALAVLFATPLAAQAGARGDPLDAVLEWLEPLVLEENDETLIGALGLAVDPAGGFLATDWQAEQVRVYGPDGALLTYFGREGQGPGEFSGLSTVARHPEGGLVALDREGRLSRWTSQGELLDHLPTGLTGVMGAAVTGPSEVAIVTVPRVTSFDALSVPMVHFFDVEARTVRDTILRLPFTRDNVMAAITLEGGLAPILGDRFGVTWTVFDSLWVVDLAQRRVTDRIHLQSEALAANPEPVDRRRDPEGFAAYVREATLTGNAYPAPGGGWLVMLLRMTEDAGRSLLLVDASGRRIWEIESEMWLLAVDPEAGILYFREPTELEPNVVWRARLRNLAGGS